VDTEADRVRAAYARRAELGLDARYEYWRPANLFIYQARERAMISVMGKAGALSLDGKRVLDVGCGDGAVLRDMLRYGARSNDLHGIDLLPDRVERARSQTPGAHIDCADAHRLPYDTGEFDLVLGFTLLSSLRDVSARQQVASEMSRVARPGGLVLVYDFWLNPTNRHVHALRRSEVRALFQGHDVEFKSTTLAPPIVRALTRAPGGWIACTCLDMLPFLRTHYIAAVHN
jgi:ubiquinone/menaquinone biosynthesis C-methylase UbiE